MVTPDQVYRLDAARLRVLCERNGGRPPVDPLTQSPLTEGAQVVICHCGVPFLQDTWGGLGGHCSCRAQETRLRPFPSADNRAVGRGLHRIVVRDRRLAPRPVRSTERRLVETGITAAILLLAAKVGFSIVADLWAYTNGLHVNQPGDLLYNLGVLALTGLLFVLIDLVGGMWLVIGLGWLLFNLFEDQQGYRDPLPTLWESFWHGVSTLVENAAGIVRGQGVL